ncbi:hypothetical protein [Rhodovulum sp. MB263]|uniref:hypothetical protein n=1 Tax=Rhodovulum sp. (strain MB263) TaxID=308754 RepID=UPI0018C88E56|nr:hypothetical protein [Rhodovulum sp. MB263]
MLQNKDYSATLILSVKEAAIGLLDNFPGIILDRANTHSFTVQKCPEKHTGQGRALINGKKRDGTKRFQIVRLTAPRGRCAYAAVVGHNDRENIIRLDYDLRKTLGVDLGQEVEIEVKKCVFLGILRWYLTVPDPLIRVPAYLAMVSTFLGFISLVLALRPT